MIAETLSLDFVGNAAGLQDAVMASQRALAALNRDSSRIGFGIGRAMRTIVTPIASVVLSAFAAKKALADFTQSGLPGVTAFNQAMGLMRLSMFRLSSAVGELLAPAAIRTANIIRGIAERLEPLVRQVTATIPSIAAFFKQLGLNALNALKPLAPTIAGIMDSMMSNVKGIDWAGVWNRVKQAWQSSWQAIAQFVAPILVRLTTLMDTFVSVARDAIIYISNLVRKLLVDLGINLPQVAGQGLSALAGIVQNALIVGIAALEIALKNIPLLFEAIAASASLAANTLISNWRGVGDYIIDLLLVVAGNGQKAFSTIFAGMQPTLNAFGNNLYDVLSAAFESLSSIFGPLADRFGIYMSKGLASGIVKVLDLLPGHSGIADILRPASELTWDEISKQNPWNPKRPKFPTLRDIPAPNFALPLDLKSLPVFKGWDQASMDRFNAAIQGIKSTFGPGIGGLVQDAFARAQIVAAQLNKNLPQIGGQPGARLDRFEPIGPLLFGSREAASRESNQGSKNPLVPLAQQQLAATTDQEITLRAIQRAAERKARIANF